MKKTVIITLFILSLFAALANHFLLSNQLPDYIPSNKEVVLYQNWSTENRVKYYHTPQGTQIMPYAWFIALEQPVFSLFSPAPLFTDHEFMEQLGFVIGEKKLSNKKTLAIGFTEHKVNHQDGSKVSVLGMTCSACHTGKITYRGTAIRVDGGAAMINVTRFQELLGKALLYTYIDPIRFNRFANSILGENHESTQHEQLKADLKIFLDSIKQELDMYKQASERLGQKVYGLRGGPGRTDALGRGGNFVFGVEAGIEENIVVANAPVSFPPLWDTPWFDWVEYNAAIRQPMARNIAEAIGVRARVNLNPASSQLFSNTTLPRNLIWIEGAISGNAPFEGLRPPAWPEDILGKINQHQATKGKILYKELCESCHLPPVNSNEIKKEQYWSKASVYGRKFLKIPVIPVALIGTDPQVINNLTKRRASLPELNLENVTATEGLKIVTSKIEDKLVKSHQLTNEEIKKLNSYRKNEWRIIQAYRARPLNGIWTSPPYLHNGSVPNMMELLGTVKDRSKTFYTGQREYDPVNVGLISSKLKNGFLFNTSLDGNHNTGHEFRNAPANTPGVIGKALSDDEKISLIEYLKTL